MDQALRHTLVALASGATAVLLLVVCGTVLMLGSVFGITPDGMGWWAGATAGSCYLLAPVAGGVAFVAGLTVSIVSGFLPSRAVAANPDIGPVRITLLRGLVLLPGLCVVLILVVVALCVFWPAATEYR